jgi:methylenetetrahydrofolate reductase (NADPH)
MKLSDLFNKEKTVVSFEIFPPKQTITLETIFKTTEGLQTLNPDFISITYGAGGSASDRTIETADKIKNTYGVEALAHLTCINSHKDDIEDMLNQLQAHKINNILAMRGDYPLDKNSPKAKPDSYQYAKDLIAHIKSHHDFCIAAAAYPEGHLECPSLNLDTLHLKEKVDSGTDFLITQIFFDNQVLYDFLNRIRQVDIMIPVCAGIMPLLNSRQVARIHSLCGASIPKPLQKMIEKYENSPADFEKAGIEYACSQIIDLVDNKVDGIHLYTMNKLDQSKTIIQQTGLR